jgi:xanthine dehydrogenase molybdenum-binding subunit
MSDEITRFTYEIPPEIMSWDGQPSYDWNAIGKSGLKHVDADAKVNGTAIYTRDISVPGMTYGRVLVSPYAHAEIKSIDTSRAEALPGVIKVITWDGPEIASLGEAEDAGAGATGTVEVLKGYTIYEGEICGAIVIAETDDIAEEGLRLLDIEWDEQSFVLDVKEAYDGDTIANPRANPDNNQLSYHLEEMGDPEAAFKASDNVVEFSTYRTVNTWAGVEAGSCIARVQGDEIEVWIHTQSPTSTLQNAMNLFKVPMNTLNAHFPFNGATYGEGSSPGAACVNLAILSTLTVKRPVKIILGCGASHFMGGSMDYGKTEMKVGFNNDGKINAVYSNCIVGDSEMPALFAFPGSAYYLWDSTSIPNIKEDRTSIQTNQGTMGTMRCEGLSSATHYSLIMNRVAAELGMDPIDVAYKNDGNCGDGPDFLVEYRARHGFPDVDGLTETLEAGRVAADWDNKWHTPGTKQLDNGKMHGISVGWMHGWHFDGGVGDCNIELMYDGTARILSQHPDIGVAAETTYCQFVADEIGLKYENVKHWNKDDTGPRLMSPGASFNLTTNTFALRKAAREVKRKLLELATCTGEYEKDLMDIPGGNDLSKWSKFPGLQPEALDIKDGIVFEKANPDNSVPVSTVAAMRAKMELYHGPIPGGYPDELKAESPFLSILDTSPEVKPIYGYGWWRRLGDATYINPLPRAAVALTRQAHFCEVEVDTETGEIDVTRVVCVNDPGKIFNLESCEGQEYGGTYMGISRAEMEEVVYDPTTGVKMNDNLLDYKIALIGDIGEIPVTLVETSLGWGAYGSVGIGESAATVVPGTLAPAVYNAIGKWIYDLPITPAKVLEALGKA